MGYDNLSEISDKSSAALYNLLFWGMKKEQPFRLLLIMLLSYLLLVITTINRNLVTSRYAHKRVLNLI